MKKVVILSNITINISHIVNNPYNLSFFSIYNYVLFCHAKYLALCVRLATLTVEFVFFFYWSHIVRIHLWSDAQREIVWNWEAMQSWILFSMRHMKNGLWPNVLYMFYVITYFWTEKKITFKRVACTQHFNVYMSLHLYSFFLFVFFDQIITLVDTYEEMSHVDIFCNCHQQ